MASAELRGLRALVTGASKGIGYAVANRLHDEGATVLATARTAPSLPDGIQFIAADLGSVEGCGAVAAAVRDRLGGIDIVVHVVGGSSAPAGGFAVLDDEEWHRALDLNLFPAVRLDRALRLLDRLIRKRLIFGGPVFSDPRAFSGRTRSSSTTIAGPSHSRATT